MTTHHPDNDGELNGEPRLKKVGRLLMEAREQNGESLEEVSRITRIGKNYLEALEEGAADKLPSQAYTRGFIRLYAAHLGLSQDETLGLLSEQPAESPQQKQQKMRTAPSAPLTFQRQSLDAARLKKLLLPLAAVVVLALGVALFMTRQSQKSPPTASGPQAVSQPSSGAVPDSPGTMQPLQKVDTPPAAADLQSGSSEASSEEGIVLRLKAVSGGRLHITIDGSVSQEYDLVAGDLVEWKAERMFLLDLDNAGSVEGELNGKALAPFGEGGKAVHLIIRQNGVEKD